ncbi:MAG: ATP-binding cassette domain-containing protein, partial [Candidatus Rokuibacteriota bacterium]
MTGEGAANGWLLETRGLTKRFGGLVAVDELALAVRPGELRGLIGPNGSGKTTTVNLLSGLYRADAGEI